MMMHSLERRTKKQRSGSFEMFVNEEPLSDRSAPPRVNTSRRRRDRRAALQLTINVQERDERQRAVRALLSQPLLFPDGPTSDAFTLVQKHREWLRPWFAHHADWQLLLDSEAARLIKRPAKLNDATRPCREPNSGTSLSRRAYVILCLALASLVRADRQTTLVRLRDSILGLLRAEPRFEAAGVRVELEHQDSRRDFVHAIRLLLAWGALRRQRALGNRHPSRIASRASHRMCWGVSRAPSRHRLRLTGHCKSLPKPLVPGFGP